jgi:hypothetical protein
MGVAVHITTLRTSHILLLLPNFCSEAVPEGWIWPRKEKEVKSLCRFRKITCYYMKGNCDTICCTSACARELEGGLVGDF